MQSGCPACLGILAQFAQHPAKHLMSSTPSQSAQLSLRCECPARDKILEKRLRCLLVLAHAISRGASLNAPYLHVLVPTIPAQLFDQVFDAFNILLNKANTGVSFWTFIPRHWTSRLKFPEEVINMFFLGFDNVDHLNNCETSAPRHR